ncbi:hypothetical protein SN811_08430 [Ligilactobacillus agilis]|uniref:Sporulation protein Cse60 n=1 Tax=Ligilactobacillus agilis TaxID=1601 RepID=A0A6F9Y455_9LACO|nr:hypothetical protein [Ligilactobacillus agilis]GET12343.1 hypothetical protein SN811_08430 [Ligilactobacillus agilis]
MCRTRIKVIDEYTTGEDAEELVNGFISNPENKVAKVNSIETEIYYDRDDDPYMVAVINYELGE